MSTYVAILKVCVVSLCIGRVKRKWRVWRGEKEKLWRKKDGRVKQAGRSRGVSWLFLLCTIYVPFMWNIWHINADCTFLYSFLLSFISMIQQIRHKVCDSRFGSLNHPPLTPFIPVFIPSLFISVYPPRVVVGRGRFDGDLSILSILSGISILGPLLRPVQILASSTTFFLLPRALRRSGR